MKFIKKFENHNGYESFIAGGDYPKPNVSYCANENEVHYNPWVEPPYQGFCKLTLNDGSVVELEGSGELTSTMTSPYRDTCISAEIGETCTSIDSSAFQSCSNLTSVNIGNGVTTIGSSAFYQCSGLTSVIIGSGVASIMNNSFRDCTNLNSITSLAVTAPAIINTTFKGVGSQGILTVPKNSFGYDNWIQNNAYYLGMYGWTTVEQ